MHFKSFKIKLFLKELRYQRNTVLKVQLLLILRRGLPHLCIFVDFKAWATPPYVLFVDKAWATLFDIFVDFKAWTTQLMHFC